jgi:hypothetical protein
MNNKTKIFIAIGIIALIGTASALLEGRTLPPTLPDGRPITDFPEISSDESLYNITNVSNSLNNPELNTLYYKFFVPDDIGDQWNLSVQFAESKPYFLLKPTNIAGTMVANVYTGRGFQYAWLCCNISRGDRLFTSDATNDSSLRGTLTNLYNYNYKARVYVLGTWYNYFVGASTIPDVYNRRAKLHIDGTQIAYAMETRNVTNTSVPELMKVFLI